MQNHIYEEYIRKFSSTYSYNEYDENDHSFDARHGRLKRRAQGTEPFVFDEVMEHIYSPTEGEMFIDNSIVEHDGKLWMFHIVGKPDNLGRKDPRIRKLDYEYCGYAIGKTLFDFKYQGLVQYKPENDWEAIAAWIPAHIVPFDGGFVSVYTAVGLSGTKIGVAFSKNLIDWEPHPDNPVIHPPEWANYNGSCKDVHVMRHNGKYFIYYRVDARNGYNAIALSITEDWKQFEFKDEPIFTCPGSLRGTSGMESPCIVERDGIFHLFYCCGQGTWHAISDNPYKWNGMKGQYLVGPFVAAEVFKWDGEWWFSSTKKEEHRRLDRLKGISHHGDIYDERRNLSGMFLARICWEGDFPVLAKPCFNQPYSTSPSSCRDCPG